MHITILALGSHGDILPYAVLGKGLVAAGHRVRLATFASFAPLAAEYGLEIAPLRGDPKSLVARGGGHMLRTVRSFGALAESYTQDLSGPGLGETDLIVNQLPMALFGYDLAERYGVPMLAAAVIPLWPTRAFAMMGMPHLPVPGYNRLTYALSWQLGWQLFRPVVNRWRQQTLGLPPHPFRGYFDQLGTRRVPVLNGFSRHVVPRPPDWGAHIHLTGYWYPRDEGWQPPVGLVEFLASGPPPVFVGFGSMPLPDPARTSRVVVDALARAGMRGVLQAGWGGLGGSELPEDVYRIDYAPYEWLFPRMALVIHHGGSGTTAHALRAGVPSLVTPMLFDQFFWGERVAALGVGPHPLAFKRLTVDRLAAAIASAVADQDMCRRAADLSRLLTAEEGVSRAVELIEGYLYA